MIADPLDSLKTIELDKRIITLETESAQRIEITFLTDRIFRLRVTPVGDFAHEGSLKAKIVIQSDPLPIAIQLSRLADYDLIQSEYLSLRVYPNPLRFELFKKDNQTLVWKELKPIHLGPEDSYQTLANGEEQSFFGGGQQNGAFEFQGKALEVSYSGGWEEGDRPSPAPFYMASHGYGVLRNTWKDGTYDFKSRGYLTTSHQENRFDAYYFNGESIHEVLAQYTWLTGRAALLPRWAYEYGDADCYNDGDNEKKPGTVPEGWRDGATGTTPDVVKSLAAKYREHDMPGGWILPNDGYGCGYEDLPQVVKGLAEFGFRTGLWTENGVEKIAWEVGEAGTRAQKLDVAWTGKGYQFSLDANQAAAEGIIANSQSRPFIWTVMGWAGTQRYAVTWTGDQSGSWDYIRWHIPTLIGSGLSGQVYATGDVDGIFGGSPETFTRDLQWKSFTPVLMGMSGWSKAARKHPWWFEEPYRSINRKYLKLKMRLMPYLYSYAWQAERTGSPIVRGLMWDFPDDPHAYSEKYKYQFFLGNDFLVAPVYQSQSASEGWREGIYLPQGLWTDYWDGRVISVEKGGQTIDYRADLDRLPLLIKGGAILPMYPEALYDGQVPKNPLTLDLYPSGESTFLLYEDDGLTRDYKTGSFSTQRIEMRAPKEGIGDIHLSLGAVEGSFEGLIERRHFEVMVHSRVHPQGLYLDGQELPAFSDRSAYNHAEVGWFFDRDDRYGVIFAKLGERNVREPHALVVSIEGNQSLQQTGGFPRKPEGDNRLNADSIRIVSRPSEEPGYPLENALDRNPETWFRTTRDYASKTGPHEFVLSLGHRRTIHGIELSPRTDKYWKYGQVRDYEIYVGDINGEWGDPVASGRLEEKQEKQVVEFAARTGRLMRFRVLSTQDQGHDPMVLGASEGEESGAYNALLPMKVNPLTLSEFSILESRLPESRGSRLFLSEIDWESGSAFRGEPVEAGREKVMNGITFAKGFAVAGTSRIDFKPEGPWQTFRAEVGVDDSCSSLGSARFQLYGDSRLLWDSGILESPAVAKPVLDIRGVVVLSLRTVASSEAICLNWADARVMDQ